jgi:Zn-dependent M28 family amino/carboxypeptidase
MQGNEQLRPIFREWLAPFKEYDASTITVNSTGGTDHLPFDAAGLPGFQFIQDPIEYFTRTWHTTQDVSDRILEQDLKRSAIIMAAFAYNSAMTNEKLPRKATAATAVASLLGGMDYRTRMDEIAFRQSGLSQSVCGHELQHEELPLEFPTILTLGTNRFAAAE